MAKRKKVRRRRADRLPLYEEPTYRELQRRLAGNARRLRAERELNQEEAAHQCEMSTRLYQRAETAGANLTLTTLARICHGFHVDVSELFAKAR
ncbi:MAG: helix-turn-helix transcriptional regulator [Archangiaceae bacterium]|nr:helix-turn-helix transcriptional regulator [Archangiaceae bacterium]